MRKGSIFIVLIVFVLNAFSQNMVPNGDFDTYTIPPSNYGQTDRALGWNNVNGKTGGGAGSPDYFYDPDFMPPYFGPIHASFGGGGQMGFCTWHGAVPNFREFLARPLLAPLTPGKEYQVFFILSNGYHGDYTRASNNIGIHFSIGPLTQVLGEPIPVDPQIEITSVNYIVNEWKPFSFSFIATAPFNNITIGNFRSDAATLLSDTGSTGAYYFIDEIAVVPVIQNLQVTGDSFVCKGSSATLHAWGTSTYSWVDIDNPGVVLSTASSLLVTPLKTTTYKMSGATGSVTFTVTVLSAGSLNLGKDTSICEGGTIDLDAGVADDYLWSTGATTRRISVSVAGNYSVRALRGNCAIADTIAVSYSTTCKKIVYFPNSFTPNRDGRNDDFRGLPLSNLKNYELSVFNRYGKKIFTTNTVQQGWDGKIGGIDQPVGSYTWICRYKFFGVDQKTETKTGVVTLLR